MVDDGPYRRLDDPANADFLKSLAQGRTPRELIETEGNVDVMVGLIDKRNEDYVEEFRSFSGAGHSLGTTAARANTDHFDSASLPEPPALDPNAPSTSIAVRMLNGQRRVVKINLNSTVADLAAHVRDAGGAFRLAAGFPPAPLTDASKTIQEAGLKGAQVSMQKVD